jgi:hypothetical protein
MSRNYQVYKVKTDGLLEPMGLYEANTPKKAIDKMVERGNLSGNEWAMEYIAIPYGKCFRRYIPQVER